MAHRRGLGLALAIFVLHPVARGGAQPNLQSHQNIHLEIRGSVTVTGSVPVPLADLPDGQYRIRAGGLGLVRAKGRLDCLPDNTFAFRSWSSARSLLLPPGLTHIGGGETLRGYLLFTAATATAYQSLRLDNAHADAADDVRAAVAAYNQAVSEQDIADGAAAIRTSRAKEEDTAELRRWWISFLAATWIGSAAEALLLTPHPRYQRGDNGDFLITVPAAEKWQAGLRSFLVPGSGQRYLGKEVKGNLFSAGVLGLGAATLIAQESFLNARRDQLSAQHHYDASETVDQLEARRETLIAAADKADDRSRLRWILFGATLGTYLLNIVDAVADASPNVRSSAVSWSVTPNRDGLQAGVSWRLP